MKYNKDQQKNEMSIEEQALQINTDHTQEKENVSAQKDGFRYDYNDNADL